jgi:hypothetical protein
VKWSTSNFEAVSEQERQQYSNNRPRGNFKDLDGWSGRSGLLSKGSGTVTPFLMDIVGQQIEIEAINRRYVDGKRAIGVRLGDGSTRQLWSIDLRPRVVSKMEYEAFLQ